MNVIPQGFPSVIDMQGVSKRFGSVQALRDFDFEAAPGEIVAFLGPNGAGKTTAISIMLGMKRPSSGTVKLFGAAPDSRQARSRVGAMLQESSVPENLKVEEVVRLFQGYYPYTLPTGEILARAELTEKRHALTSSLSGGQKQRLTFALALAGDPDLLFLDEPTAAMDIASRRAFWEQVRDFAALGKTILFSTHYLEEADACARVVVMSRGHVIAEGAPQEIKRLVAAKTVRFKSDLGVLELQTYPEVKHLEVENDHLLIYTNHPEELLARLFGEGHKLSDLTVEEADLESAFITLMKGADA